MLRNDPDRDWERFGAEDPYYSVLNTEAYRRDRLDADGLAGIFESGERDLRALLAGAELACGRIRRGRALDFGCGVGRLLRPLASEFEEAVGVDVSGSMLALAARHCPGARLCRSDDRLSAVNGEFDFVFSCLVFQHIPVERGERLMRELLRRLRPDGVAALHFTIARSSPAWRQWVHRLRCNFLPAHRLANLASGLRWDEPLMQTNLYSPARLRAIAREEGVEFRGSAPVQHADHLGETLFLRKARSQREDEAERRSG